MTEDLLSTKSRAPARDNGPERRDHRQAVTRATRVLIGRPVRASSLEEQYDEVLSPLLTTERNVYTVAG